MVTVRLKDRDKIHCVVVGDAGYPRGSGRYPVDTRELRDACQVEGCTLEARQAHGLPDDLILTCDDHVEAVTLWLLEQIT